MTNLINQKLNTVFVTPSTAVTSAFVRNFSLWRCFFRKSRSSKSMKNVVFHDKLYRLTLIYDFEHKVRKMCSQIISEHTSIMHQ